MNPEDYGLLAGCLALKGPADTTPIPSNLSLPALVITRDQEGRVHYVFLHLFL